MAYTIERTVRFSNEILEKEIDRLKAENELLKKEIVRLQWMLEHQD